HVWDTLPDDAKTPVHDMVVHGDAAAGVLEFSAWQQCVAELAVITDAGVLELLPFDRPERERSYALVWSLPRERADALLALDAAAFELELAAAASGEVGALSLATERAAWPLVVGGAAAWSGPGWVLVGDAAHVVHPLAGQGLNLGLADVAALTATVAGREPWRALGDERLLRRYERQRAAPTWAMR